VTYISKEEAPLGLPQGKSFHEQAMSEGLEDNPLPAPSR